MAPVADMNSCTDSTVVTIVVSPTDCISESSSNGESVQQFTTRHCHLCEPNRHNPTDQRKEKKAIEARKRFAANEQKQTWESQLIEYVVILCSWVKSGPYTVQRSEDGSHLRLRRCHLLGRWIYHLAAFFRIIISILLFVGLCFRIQSPKKSSPVLSGVHAMKLLVFGATVMVDVAPLLHPREILSSFNAGVTLHQRLLVQGHAMKRWSDSLIIVTPIFGVFGFSGFLALAMGGTGYFYGSNDWCTVTGVLKLVYPVSRSQHLVLSSLETALMWLSSCTDSFIMTIYWSYYVNSLNWLHFFRFNKNTDLDKELQFLEQGHLFFRSMQNFSIVFNVANIELMSMTVFLLSGSCTMCLYVALTMYSRLPLPVYFSFCFSTVTMLFVIIVTLSQVGQIRSQSAKVICLWRHRLYAVRSAVLAAKGNAASSEFVQQINYLLRLNKSLRFFGIRFLNIYLSIKTSPRILESIFTFLIIALTMKVAH